MGIKAGVVVVNRFCKPGSGVFAEYIDYIDRDEAVRNKNIRKFNLYNDYMDDPEKTSGLFTAGKSELSQSEKEDLKEVFQTAQDNGSLMWQTVISFDNPWLEQFGLYDHETGMLDELKIKELASGAVNRMLENEGLQNAVWSASIHYNTDNIHVHVATVEPYPERAVKEYTVYLDEKKKIPLRDENGNMVKQTEHVGRFKGRSLELCKKYIVDEVVQQQDQNILINNLIRNTIVKQMKETTLATDPELRDAFLKLHQSMPKTNRGLWNYNNNIMKKLHPLVDAVSDAYLKKYHQAEYQELKGMLMKQEQIYKTAYGTNSGRSFSENKLKELYERMGNAVLKEIRNYDKEIQRLEKAGESGRGFQAENYELQGSDTLKAETADFDLIQAEHSAENNFEPDKLGMDDMDGFEDINLHFSNPNFNWSKEYKSAMSLIYSKNPDYQKAHDLLVEEYGRGNVLAACALGDMYRLGRGCDINLGFAEDFYKDAASGLRTIINRQDKKTIGYAEYRLGKLYQYGYGVEKDYQKAYKYFCYAADDGCIVANFSLGNMYFFGTGIEKDFEAAEKHYLAADGARRVDKRGNIISEGNAFAEYRLGEIYRKGLTGEPDPEKGNHYYKKAYDKFLELAEEEEQADDNLYYRLGVMLQEGLGAETDEDAAQVYFEKAAEAGNSNAAYRLAKIYLKQEDPELLQKAVILLEKAAGKGQSASAQYALGNLYSDRDSGRFDIDKAVYWFEKAVKNENGMAMYSLGKLYLDKEMEIFDLDKAVHYLEMSAEQGNEFAQYQLGKIYHDRESGLYDCDKAVSYYRQSAVQGNQYAQYQLGKIFLDKEAGFYNPEMAAFYFRKSADQGNSIAEYQLAKIYLDHDSPCKDIKKGFEILQSCAEKGNQYAQLEMGLQFIRGVNVERNRDKAKEWLNKSAEQGNQIALNILNDFDKYQRNMSGIHLRKLQGFSLNRALSRLKQSLQAENQQWINMRRFRELQEQLQKEQHQPKL